MTAWEITLCIAAVTFGIAVTALCLRSIRRMGRAEPDPEAIERLVNAPKKTSPGNNTPTDGHGNSEGE